MESTNKKRIVMLASIHFTQDLWQRHQQLANEFVNDGYEVTFINNRSTILNISRDYKNLTTNEINNIFLKLIMESPTIKGIVMIDRIDFIKDCTNQIYEVKDQFIKYIVQLFHNDNTSVITYLPEFSDVLANLKDTLKIKVYYDCVDEMSGFYNTKKVVIDENKLLSICDGVIVTSNTLFVRKGIKNPNCILVPNGVNQEQYSIAQDKPEDIKHLKGPVIGYVGAIAHWFDQEMVCDLAKAYPDWNFVLIGTVYINVEKMEGISNIHLLGKREYNLVPQYMQHFDVGIIPFKNNELIVNTNPIKYYEYIAAGIPVVSTIMPELIDKPYVHVASSLEEFKYGIENTISSKRCNKIDIDFLESNTWANRASKIIQFIESGSYEHSRRDTLLNISSTYEKSKAQLPVLYLLLAEIHLELNEEKKAKEYLKIFSEIAQDQSPIIQLKLYLHLNEINEVKRVLKSMDKYTYHDTDLWYNKGEKYLVLYASRKASKFDVALKLADDLIDDNDRSLFIEMGNIYYEVEQYDEAFYFFVEAYADKGEIHSLEGAVNFASLLKQKGENGLAKKVMEPHIMAI